MIDPIFRDSPQYSAASPSASLGCEIVLKIETANPIRCFKGRGADLLLASIDGDAPGLTCASAGNFGQAVAYAGRKRGVAIEVYTARDASPFKIQRMRELGAEVRVTDEDFDGAKEIAREAAEQAGRRFVEDGREQEIADGAGTIADGLASRVPVPESVTEMRHTVDRFLLVEDQLLLTAMRLLFESEGLVVEQMRKWLLSP